MPPFLEVRDLKKRFGAITALDGVSFQVEQGELFGLLGPNGAGKTTLLSIVSCLMELTAGEVILHSQPLNTRNKELRRRIGIVPQETALYGEMTARENLAFFGELYGVGGTLLKEKVQRILAAVGLEERADHRVDSFSGGMQRRLNLGAALVHEPSLLLLDEPTVGVDPQSRNRIFEEIRRVNGQGVTIIYTSHYMEEVQSLCPRVGIIDHGKLIAYDTVAHLLTQLNGVLRFRVSSTTPELQKRISELPDIRSVKETDGLVELECRDVKAGLVRLSAVIANLGLELTHLETEEPNLERVFLHLTGRGLRD